MTRPQHRALGSCSVEVMFGASVEEEVRLWETACTPLLLTDTMGKRVSLEHTHTLTHTQIWL